MHVADLCKQTPAVAAVAVNHRGQLVAMCGASCALLLLASAKQHTTDHHLSNV